MIRWFAVGSLAEATVCLDASSTHRSDDDDQCKQEIERILAAGDFFDLLGVQAPVADSKLHSRTADIRRAYKRLAKLVHPDRTADPGAVEAFSRLQEAFAVLSDESLRVLYAADLTGGASSDAGSMWHAHQRAGHAAAMTEEEAAARAKARRDELRSAASRKAAEERHSQAKAQQKRQEEMLSQRHSQALRQHMAAAQKKFAEREKARAQAAKAGIQSCR